MKKIVFICAAAMLLFVVAKPTDISADENRQLQEEIIYDIVVDRYNNGDAQTGDQVRIDDPEAYHGGDIEGIITKLDTMVELGFTTISLSPIMANAPDGYHGYWIEDFYEVEEQFGTMEDVNRLIDEAHERDIKVVIEFVTNYVSLNHPIVTDPQKEDWILDGANPPEDLDNVAVLNQDHPEVEAFLMDAASYWMEETDIDGFKLHAADEASGEFLKSFTDHIQDRDEDFYILADTLSANEFVSELKENGAITAVENHALHEAMSNVFSQVGTPVSDIYQEVEDQTGLVYIDNKHSKRFTQKLAENGRSYLSTWKLALTYMYTTPGVPMIFQGSEIPMYGADAAEAQQLVQFNSGDPDLKEFHDRISALRSEFPVLQYGDFEIVETERGMSVFKRTFKDETMYIALNNDAETRSVSLTDLESGIQLKGILGDDIVRENEQGEFKIGLARESADVFTIQEDTGFNWTFIGLVGGIFVLFISFIVFLSRKQKQEQHK
ncbi:alpha-amylase family glycosyl hydrolase [Virgibacillus byunsanensis]|uniref:Alpha-amylase family glycosyl hydrolase n=1 Tax=Virgibacillus byunsanensis TaxID=570945 RepID=A0ABW3LM32_9BACI